MPQSDRLARHGGQTIRASGLSGKPEGKPSTAEGAGPGCGKVAFDQPAWHGGKDPSKRQVRGSSPEDPLAKRAGAGARRRPSRAFTRLPQWSGRAGAAANALLLLPNLGRNAAARLKAVSGEMVRW